MPTETHMNSRATCCATGGSAITEWRSEMELYYNPEQMDESEIKRTFVARQWLLDDVLSLLKRQPKGAGVQHGVIIGPRGMGKTTMLLMLRFAVREGDLSRLWFPVRFPEESYGVTCLAD